MTQPMPLFSGPHTARSAPSTSLNAAQKIVGRLPAIRKRVMAFALQVERCGFIDEELYAYFPGIPINSLRPRRCELADENRLIDSGRKGKNSVGNDCVIWLHRDFAQDPPPIIEQPGPRVKLTAEQERRAVVALLAVHARGADPAAHKLLHTIAEQIAAGAHHL